MAIRGARPKSAELHAIIGTKSGSKYDLLPPEDALDAPKVRKLPPPPKWMTDPEALTEYREVGEFMTENELLTRANLRGFQLMCQNWGLIVKEMTGKNIGGAKYRALILQYRLFLSEFGLTPSSQLRAKAPGKTAKGNEFAKNARKAAA